MYGWTWARVVWNRIRNSRTHEPSRTIARCYHNQSQSYETITILVCLAPSSIRQLNSRQCMKRRTAGKNTIGRKRSGKMCISNRKRKNIKLLYDLWYNEWVYGRARTHSPKSLYVKRTHISAHSLPDTGMQQAAWDRHLIAKASSQQHRRRRWQKKKAIVFPNCRRRWGLTGVVHVE